MAAPLEPLVQPPEEAPGPSDRTLVRLLREGPREEAASRLYHRYARRLEALARARFSRALSRRLDPEDLVQSVFRRLFLQVDKDLCEVPEEEGLWGLLLVIALNKVRAAERFFRADKRDVAVTCGQEGLDRHLASHGQAGDHDLKEMACTVDEALERLPPRHREVARLRLAGYEVAEIAGRLGRSLRTAERLLQECRAKLEGYCDGPT